MGVQSHQLARGEGNGSRESIQDKYDSEEYEEKDQRADTRTTFYDRDIDRLEVSERRKKRLRRMLRRQEGEDYGEGTIKDKSRRQRKQQNRSEWKRRVVSTFASQLDLTRAQKERVKYLVKDVLDINTFGYYSTEQVVLATINVVVREDDRWIEDEQKFRKLMVQVGLGRGEHDETPDLDSLKTLRGMVRDRIRD